MVDTPKEGNGDETAQDDPSKKQPKRQRQWRRSKSRQSKSGDTGTGDNSPRTMPKTTTIPSSKIQSRRMEKPALPRERQMERWKMIITCLPPKTRQASTMMNLPCLGIPSSKSASSVGL